MADTESVQIEETCDSDDESDDAVESSELGEFETESVGTEQSMSSETTKKVKKPGTGTVKSASKKSTSGSVKKKKKRKVKKKKDASFIVDLSDNTGQKSSNVSLQQAFKKFRKSKQGEWKEESQLRQIQLQRMAEPGQMEELRKKFLEQAKKYFGVPYKRKYWPKEAPEYKSPLFLDCCGLVRRVMYDLRYDFGFKLGPWNQAYMNDTLPITVHKEADMKPGDLVFISAIYNNPKARAQRHNMVHVEIWLGDGPKTIGARWQKGKVQVFDHYKFNATSYHSPKYIFKSIDTWLKGICKSYCDKHPWRRRGKPLKLSQKSVFAKRDSDQQGQDDDCLDANDTDDELIQSADDPKQLEERLRESMAELDLAVEEEEGLMLGEFGSQIASSSNGVGCLTNTNSRKNGSVKLSSSPDHEKYLVCTSGDAMETVATAVNYMAKGRVDVSSKDSNSKAKDLLNKGNDSSGPIKLKMTNSQTPLQPAGRGPHPTASQKEPSRRVSLPALPVQKSAPASYGNRSQSLPVGKNVSKTEQKSAPASSRRSSQDKESPYHVPPMTRREGVAKIQQAAASKNQNNNAKPTKLESETKADSKPLASLSSSKISKPEPPKGNNSKNGSTQNQSGKTAQSGQGKSVQTAQQSPPARGQVKSPPVQAAATKTSSGQNGKQVSQKASVKSPPPPKPTVPQGSKTDTKPSAETSSGHRRQSDTGTTSKLPPPKVKPQAQDDTDKKTSEKKEPSKGASATEEPSIKDNTADDGSPKKVRSKLPPTVSLANNQTPMFYIGGYNGAITIEKALVNLGWKRTTDKTCDNFRLKWTEAKNHINYTSFKEGEQMVNHLPNCHLLTNKLGLMNSLREYERITMATKKGRPPRLKFTDILPETYNLHEKGDRELFYETYKEGEIWICKPTGMNQGRGIFLVRDLEEVTKYLEERDEKLQNCKPSRRPMPRIIQRYIKDPLLIHGRKFDIRAYMLIASTVPYIVLYHSGYIRLTCNKYCKDSTDLATHLTNQFVQKKDPLYKDNKEDTVMSMDQFNTYCNEKFGETKGLEQNWVNGNLVKQMQRIMLHLFNAVRHKLTAKVGFFELYGLDFMVDENMKVWLIEVNINPALHIHTEILKDTIPPMVEESLAISIEVFDKVRKSQPIYPVKAIKNFTYLYSGVDRRAASNTENQKHGGSPSRTKSASPVRDDWQPRGRSHSGPYTQPLNLPKINARTNQDAGHSGAHGVRTSATETSTSGDVVKLKMTHAEGGATRVGVGKGEKQNRGN